MRPAQASKHERKKHKKDAVAPGRSKKGNVFAAADDFADLLDEDERGVAGGATAASKGAGKKRSSPASLKSAHRKLGPSAQGGKQSHKQQQRQRQGRRANGSGSRL